MADIATPYDDGGTLSPGTSWISFPEEVFVFSDADLAGLRAVASELDILFSTTAGDD